MIERSNLALLASLSFEGTARHATRTNACYEEDVMFCVYSEWLERVCVLKVFCDSRRQEVLPGNIDRRSSEVAWANKVSDKEFVFVLLHAAIYFLAQWQCCWLFLLVIVRIGGNTNSHLVFPLLESSLLTLQTPQLALILVNYPSLSYLAVVSLCWKGHSCYHLSLQLNLEPKMEVVKL